MALTQKMSGRLEAYGRSEMNAPTEKAADCAGSSVNAKTPVLVAAPSTAGEPSSAPRPSPRVLR
ncbi:hypothetical protein [Streptomyces sp. NPDC002779]|uniref:hypothetical protein n=1 Tax=Streptomyces sp. NPDC002779 TaxID=3364664 RepID=UPI00368B50B2